MKKLILTASLAVALLSPSASADWRLLDDSLMSEVTSYTNLNDSEVRTSVQYVLNGKFVRFIFKPESECALSDSINIAKVNGTPVKMFWTCTNDKFALIAYAKTVGGNNYLIDQLKKAKVINLESDLVSHSYSAIGFTKKFNEYNSAL